MDTSYQRAKILIEENRKLFTKLLLFTGLFIFIIFRNLFLSSYTISGMENPNLSFTQSPLFIISYVFSIFTLILIYNYIKFYLLKRSFKDPKKANKQLLKYMKTDDIPSYEDVLNRFKEDKNKDKKKFKFQIIYILSIITLLIIINMYYMEIYFLDLFIIFAAFNLFYRHLSISHFDEKFFNSEWENKKFNEYIDELNS